MSPEMLAIGALWSIATIAFWLFLANTCDPRRRP